MVDVGPTQLPLSRFCWFLTGSSIGKPARTGSDPDCFPSPALFWLALVLFALSCLGWVARFSLLCLAWLAFVCLAVVVLFLSSVLSCLPSLPWSGSLVLACFLGRCASPVIVVGSFPLGGLACRLVGLGAPRLVLPGLVCMVASRSTATLRTGSPGHRLCTVSPGFSA